MHNNFSKAYFPASVRLPLQLLERHRFCSFLSFLLHHRVRTACSSGVSDKKWLCALVSSRKIRLYRNILEGKELKPKNYTRVDHGMTEKAGIEMQH